MRFHFFAVLALLATGAAPSESARADEDLATIAGPETSLQQLMDFAREETDYPPAALPALSLGTMPEDVGSEIWSYWPGDASASYNRFHETVNLPEDWSWSLLVDQSSLVHALVHHLQAKAESPLCQRDAETEAYRVQLAYLNANSTQRIRLDPELEEAVATLPCTP